MPTGYLSTDVSGDATVRGVEDVAPLVSHVQAVSDALPLIASLPDLSEIEAALPVRALVGREGDGACAMWSNLVGSGLPAFCNVLVNAGCPDVPDVCPVATFEVLENQRQNVQAMERAVSGRKACRPPTEDRTPAESKVIHTFLAGPTSRENPGWLQCARTCTGNTYTYVPVDNKCECRDTDSAKAWETGEYETLDVSRNWGYTCNGPQQDHDKSYATHLTDVECGPTTTWGKRHGMTEHQCADWIRSKGDCNTKYFNYSNANGNCGCVDLEWPEPKQCAFDNGTTGNIDRNYVCPADRPHCDGYVAGTRWGTCKPKQCAFDYGTTGNIDSNYVCPVDYPHCNGYVINQHWGACEAEPTCVEKAHSEVTSYRFIDA